MLKISLFKNLFYLNVSTIPDIFRKSTYIPGLQKTKIN